MDAVATETRLAETRRVEGAVELTPGESAELQLGPGQELLAIRVPLWLAQRLLCEAARRGATLEELCVAALAFEVEVPSELLPQDLAPELPLELPRLAVRRPVPAAHAATDDSFDPTDPNDWEN